MSDLVPLAFVAVPLVVAFGWMVLEVVEAVGAAKAKVERAKRGEVSDD